jgi:diguanylate cyclase (GGDEF)-like protein/PAS domain S-box-containing protein
MKTKSSCIRDRLPYEIFFARSPVPMVICEPTALHILDANESAIRQFGYSREKLLNMLLGDLWTDRWDSDIYTENDELELLSTTPWNNKRIKRQDGSYVFANIQQNIIPFQRGKAALIVLQDATPYIKLYKRLRQAQDEWHRLHELGAIGTWTWDANTDLYESLSPEIHRIFGWNSGQTTISTDDLYTRIHPEDRCEVTEARTRALSDPNYTCNVHFRIIRPSGELRYVRSIAEVQFDENGRVLKMIELVQDETEQKRHEQEIRNLAYFDEVTSLPDRHLFERVFRERLARQPAEKNRVAFLIVNLVRFRDINYALGHANGDVLLQIMAERISRHMRPGDLVARVGTRFPIMLINVDQFEAKEFADNLHDALEAPFSVTGIPCEIDTRIGIATSAEHGNDYSTLLRKADVALYQATQTGKNVSIYDPQMDPHTPERVALIGELRNAIEKGEVCLYCQPKINIQTKEIVGAEALVRWLHPKMGIIQPDRFIPMIESTDLIHVLTQHMLASSVEQYRSWQHAGVNLPLAVNLSTRDVAAMNLSGHLQGLLNMHETSASALEFEVTESSLMANPTVSIAELGRLSSMGFRLYVDDFGTGYSSLSYLTQLPVDAVKIDHGFTMNMVRDERAAAIVKSTIHLAHDLGMIAVAEGTADRKIWDALAELGCDEAQGYFISPPLPAEGLLEWAHASQYSLPSNA